MVDVSIHQMGREYYVIQPRFEGEFRGHYRFQFYLNDPHGNSHLATTRDLWIPNEFDRYGLGISSEQLRQVYPEFEIGDSISVDAIMTLMLDNWAVDPQWVNARFPASKRSSVYRAELQLQGPPNRAPGTDWRR